MSAGLQGAIETAPVTRLHEHRSYDPADFAVPTGREEEWRFTPLRRLRGLHGDAPLPAAKVTVEVDPAPRSRPFLPNGPAVSSDAPLSRPTG
jgi:Fe-S cluster assembly protein SufD